MSDEHSVDDPADLPLRQRESKVPAEDDAEAVDNPDHSALVAEIVARDKSLLDRLAES